MDPTVRGNQPAGPNRWKRAKQWAAAHPNSAQAKKYVARVDAAREIVLVEGEHAWLHYRNVSWEPEPRYEGQSCSTRCAFLQLQVDLGCAGLEQLYSRAQAKPDRFLVPRPANSTRRGKCRTCGGDVT